MSDAYSDQEDRFGRRNLTSAEADAMKARDMQPECTSQMSHWEEIQMQLEKLNCLASDLANMLRETKVNLIGIDKEVSEDGCTEPKQGEDCYVDTIKSGIYKAQMLINRSIHFVEQIKG